MIRNLRPRLRNYLADYVLVLGPARTRMHAIVAMMLGSALLDLLGLGMVAPFAQMLTTGTSVASIPSFDRHPRLAFLLTGVALIGVFVVKAFVGYRLNERIVHFSAGYRAELIRRLLAAYQAQTWQFHLDTRSSDLVNRVLWYTQTYAGSTLAASLQLVADASVAVAILALLAVSDIVSVTILAVFLGIVFLASHRFVRPRLKDANVQSATQSARVIRGTTQALEGFRVVRNLGMETYFRDHVGEAALQLAHASARASALGWVPRYTFEVAVVAVLVIVSNVTSFTKGSTAAAVPVLGMFAAAAIRLLPASTSMLSSFNQVRASRFILGALAEELGALGESEATPTAHPAATLGSKPFTCLELEAVSFGYPGTSAPVLREVSFSIHAGEAVGIMGKSGAGKSTLADILLGFLVPDSGQVRVNGEDIQRDVGSWLRRTTYIPQNVFLLDDTLRRNIEFGPTDHTASEERMSLALQQAQLADFVASLPKGLDTYVGEGGTKLSGGQRQRVALARALYHEREFIVLDEATSALDAETEDAVVKAVMGLSGVKTLLVIAHRESTLEGCSTRLLVADGRVTTLRKHPGATRTASA